jgi:hypothetical protein
MIALDWNWVTSRFILAYREAWMKRQLGRCSPKRAGKGTGLKTGHYQGKSEELLPASENGRYKGKEQRRHENDDACGKA